MTIESLQLLTIIPYQKSQFGMPSNHQPITYIQLTVFTPTTTDINLL